MYYPNGQQDAKDQLKLGGSSHMWIEGMPILTHDGLPFFHGPGTREQRQQDRYTTRRLSEKVDKEQRITSGNAKGVLDQSKLASKADNGGIFGRRQIGFSVSKVVDDKNVCGEQSYLRCVYKLGDPIGVNGLSHAIEQIWQS